MQIVILSLSIAPAYNQKNISEETLLMHVNASKMSCQEIHSRCPVTVSLRTI